MDTLFLIIKIIIGIIFIPIAITLYLEKGKVLTTPKWKRYFLSNPFFYLNLVLIAILLWIEIGSYNKSKQSIEDEQLIFLNDHVYKNSLEKIKDNLTSRSITDDQKRQLLLKFQYAEYAWSKNDVEETIKVLTQMRLGNDDIGNVPKVNSFVVLNNLGVAYYKKQRNKAFLSSTYLHEAFNLVDINSIYKQTIQSNLERLDKNVNNID